LSLRSHAFFFKSLRVPLLELRNQLRLLIIDRLLSELGLLLKLFKFLVSFSVLLLELFKLSESLQLLLVNNFGLFPSIHVFKSVRLRCETRMHRLSHCVTLLLLILPVKEAFNLVNFVLNRIHRLCL